MPVAVEATGTAVVTASRSPAVTFASYTPRADHVILFAVLSSAVPAAATAPTNWSLPVPASGANPVASDSHALAVALHSITHAEANAGTLTYTATNLWNAAQTGSVAAIVLSGVNPAAIVDSLVTAFNSTNTITPHVLPALTGANLSTGSMVVRGVAKDGTGTWTTPASHTARGTRTGTSGAVALYTLNTTTTAGTNVTATNITPNAGDEYCSFSIALTAAGTYPALATVTDDFDGGRDVFWGSFVASGGAVADESNAVRLSYNGTANGLALLYTPTNYDLAGSAAFVEVKEFGNTANANHTVWLHIQPDDNHHIRFGSAGANLTARVNTPEGGVVTVGSTALNTTTHRWLRIREVSGTIFFDTAPDGSTWTNRFSTAAPFLVRPVRAELWCNLAGVAAAASSALFDNFNTTAGPVGFTGGATNTGITVGRTATGLRGFPRGASPTAVTVGRTSAGVLGKRSGATVAVVVGLSAAGSVSAVRAALATTVTAGRAATGVVGRRAAAAATTITTGRTATGVRGARTSAGPTTVTAALPAAGLVGRHADATGATIAVARTATGRLGLVSAAGFAAGRLPLTLPATLPSASPGDTCAIQAHTTAAGVAFAGGSSSGDANPTAITVARTAVGVTGITSTAGFGGRQLPLTLPAIFTKNTCAVRVLLGVAGWVDRGVLGDVDTAITVGLTAAGLRAVRASVTRTVTVNRTAAGLVAARATATRPVVATMSATGRTGARATATRTVAVGLTAFGRFGNAKPANPTIVTATLTAAGRVAVRVGAGFGAGLLPITLPNTLGYRCNITVSVTTSGKVTSGVAGSSFRPITAVISAAGVISRSRGATTTAVAVSLSASGRAERSSAAQPMTVVAARTAAGTVTVGLTGVASPTSIAVTRAAAGAIGAAGGADTPVTTHLTAAGAVAARSVVSVATTVTLTAAGWAAYSRDAARPIFVELTAAGFRRSADAVTVADSIVHVLRDESRTYVPADEGRVFAVIPQSRTASASEGRTTAVVDESRIVAVTS